jgi:hypothetical protein
MISGLQTGSFLWWSQMKTFTISTAMGHGHGKKSPTRHIDFGRL